MKSATQKNITSWITIGLSIVLALVAAVVWASDAHSDIEDEAQQGDVAVETELKSYVKEDFIKKEEYNKDVTELKTEQKSIKEDVGEIKKKVDDIHKYIQKRDRRGR